MLWIYFSILAAFLWAIGSIIDKFVLSRMIKNPFIPAAVSGIFGLIIALFYVFSAGIPLMLFENFILAFLAGILEIFGVIFYFRAVKKEEISRIIPLFYLTPLFIMALAGIFLGEIFTLIKYIGILLLVTGSILISTKNLKQFKLNNSFKIVLVSVFFFAISSVITKYLLGFNDFLTVFAMERIGVFLGAFPVILSVRKEFYEEIKIQGTKLIKFLSLGEIFNSLAIMFIIMAMSYGFATLVNTLTSIQSFFVLIIAVVLSKYFPKVIKENINQKIVLTKLIAIIIMSIGVILIT